VHAWARYGALWEVGTFLPLAPMTNEVTPEQTVGRYRGVEASLEIHAEVGAENQWTTRIRGGVLPGGGSAGV
jgi:hypothetical protein